MNPYITLLTNAVRAASPNSEMARDIIYNHARKALRAHLSSGDHAADEMQIAIEMRRLENAIDSIEQTFVEDPKQPQPISQDLATPVVSVSEPVAVRPVRREDPRPKRIGGRPAIARLKLSGVGLRVLKLMSNPYFLLLSLGMGVYLGLYHKEITALIAPIADLYIELLKMVLIPFMVSAVVVSLSRLLGIDLMRRHLGSIVMVFMSGLAIVAALGLISAAVLLPGGGISAEGRQALGQVINSSPYAVDLEVALDDPSGGVVAANAPLFDRFIPDNIFHALTAGDNLKILFFAIAFGIGLGSLRMNRSEGLRIALLSVYDVCTQLIAWVNMLLPVALCAMVAKQVATVGAGQLLAMVRFTIGFGLASVVVCLASIVIMAFAARTNIFAAFKAIREPLLLAIATRSSITCIPSATTALSDRLGYERSRVELLLPLGITLFRFGPVLYYAFTTVFVAQLYGIAISPAGYGLALLGALLTGFASAGTTGVLTISLLGVIFQPLGLPLEAALALLVTVDPVVDVFRTAAIVVPNCAATAIVYRRGRNSGQVATTGGVETGDVLA